MKNKDKQYDGMTYRTLHNWVRRRMLAKLIPLCVDCKVKKAADIANISQEYKKDLSDWEWLCEKCHMTKDGRIQKLAKYVKENPTYGHLGKKHSEETKRKISLSKKGKSSYVRTPEIRKKMSESRKGKRTYIMTEKTKQKMSMAQKLRRKKEKHEKQRKI